MLATLAFTVTALGVLVARSGRRASWRCLSTRGCSATTSGLLIAYCGCRRLFLPIRAICRRDRLVGIYLYYVRVHLRDKSCIADECHIAPLRITPGALVPRLRWVVFQGALALGCIFAGAHLFVDHLEEIASHLGTSALVLSIIITPIATELPEKFNSVLWVRDSKDTLAMGNITGAMVFQSTIPVTIGIFATPWLLEGSGLASAIIALLSSTLVYAYMRIRGKLSPWALLVGLPLYVAFLFVAFS